MMIAKFLVIQGSRAISDMMQAVDMFEKHKVVGVVRRIEIKYKEDVELDMLRAGKAVNEIPKAMDKAGGDVEAILVHLVEITDGKITIQNTGEVKAFVKEGVKVVSNGEGWYRLDEFMEKNNIK